MKIITHNAAHMLDGVMCVMPYSSCLWWSIAVPGILRATIVVKLNPFIEPISFFRLLDFIIVFHNDNDITLFVPIFDITMGIGNLFQSIASINDRF